jgi:hypothetical protein
MVYIHTCFRRSLARLPPQCILVSGTAQRYSASAVQRFAHQTKSPQPPHAPARATRCKSLHRQHTLPDLPDSNRQKIAEYWQIHVLSSVSGGPARATTKHPKLHRSTTRIPSPMCLILNGRKSPNTGRFTFHLSRLVNSATPDIPGLASCRRGAAQWSAHSNPLTLYRPLSLNWGEIVPRASQRQEWSK